MKKIKRALISVSNKKNLKPLLNILKKNKVEIISSGGTFKEIIKDMPEDMNRAEDIIIIGRGC